MKDSESSFLTRNLSTSVNLCKMEQKSLRFLACVSLMNGQACLWCARVFYADGLSRLKVIHRRNGIWDR